MLSGKEDTRGFPLFVFALISYALALPVSFWVCSDLARFIGNSGASLLALVVMYFWAAGVRSKAE